ncbi:hypothetical protein [Rheinheimera sp.]|uniref:hypothetical protein n=1 Tax=Rheinheimera sp. TaxID=1869214 RepID=UPI00273349B9|nr:hypothetical protein [Rheinheimera sp.]MDP2716486.1 hypothetical protein [Rheinheimera sp.]
MLRFPNPGSALDNLVNCYLFLYRNINRNEVFDLHDMQELLVSNGLISSSGAMGIEALLRGASKDLSRDKSYNQCKMYAELYRTLGWIQSGDKALWYNFTLLGDYIAQGVADSKRLIEECFLGMEYPNRVLSVNGTHEIRPFFTILKTLNYLNGCLSRDEMIFGPLSMDSDITDESFRSMCDELIYYRQNPIEFDKEFNQRLEARGISPVTAGNYTRFPLGALKWLNWAQPINNKKDYKKSQRTYQITAHGKTLLSQLAAKKDIRLASIGKLGLDSSLLSQSAFYGMLERAGFDTSPVASQKQTADAHIKAVLGTAEIIFSPFQSFEQNSLNEFFSIVPPSSKRVSIYSPARLAERSKGLASAISIDLKKALVDSPSAVVRDNEFKKQVQALIAHKTDEEVIQQLKQRYRTYTKEQFYPLIGQIFSCLGLNCDIPPHGVNSRRWDAIIISDGDSIPMEIKSPTEELNISVKAVRQALENKIILQSRKTEANKFGTSSLAVGYELPNERAEVASLISDIKKVYGIDIAVLGIDYLLKLAIEAIKGSKSLEFEVLAELKGIING